MSQRRTQPPLFRSLKRLRAAFWRRRVARWLVRTAWLALLVPTIAMAGYLGLGWQVQWYHWLYPMLVVVAAAFLWGLRPIGLRQMVRRLDSRLNLQARLVTGYEAGHQDNPVVQRLLQETMAITTDLRRRVQSLNRSLWLEMQTLIAISALLSALLMLDAIHPRTPSGQPVELPEPWQEPTAEEVIQPEPQLLPAALAPEMQAGETTGPQQLQAALEALADALRDPAATRSAAEAIDRGDLAGAAGELRRLADQLEALSGQAQGEIGDALQEAADQIGQDAPGLAVPLQAGSSSLEQGNLPGAAQALEALAEALEAAQQAPPQESAQAPPEEGGGGEGEQPAGQENAPGQEAPPEEQAPPGEQPQGEEAAGGGEGEGDSSGGSDQPTEEERLAIEGQPLELDSDPELTERVLQPSELGAQAGDESTSDSPFARQPLNAATGELGPDPLTYPWDKREVIRSYFTP